MKKLSISTLTKPQEQSVEKKPSQTTATSSLESSQTPVHDSIKKEISFFLSDDENSEEKIKETAASNEKIEPSNEVTHLNTFKQQAPANDSTQQTDKQQDHEKEEDSNNIDIHSIALNDHSADLGNETQQNLTSSQYTEFNFSESCSSSDNESDTSTSSSSSSSNVSSPSSVRVSISSVKISMEELEDNISISKLENSINKVNFDFSDEEKEVEEEEKKETFAASKQAEELERLKKLEEETENKKRQDEEELKKKRKEEEERKLNSLVSDFTLNRAEDFLATLINQTITEANMCDFIIEKLINEQVKQELKEICR